MTDNEIIKALECCNRPANQISCDDCPYQFSTKECSKLLIKDALDLINRQKAEIERYERENESKFDKWKLLDDRTKQRYAELYEEAKDIVRVKAIKEFAERFKSIAGIYQKDTYVIGVDEFDNLVKEMVGDESEL